MELDVGTVIERFQKKIGELTSQIIMLEVQIEALTTELETKSEITETAVEAGPITNGKEPKTQKTPVS